MVAGRHTMWINVRKKAKLKNQGDSVTLALSALHLEQALEARCRFIVAHKYQRFQRMEYAAVLDDLFR